MIRTLSNAQLILFQGTTTTNTKVWGNGFRFENAFSMIIKVKCISTRIESGRGIGNCLVVIKCLHFTKGIFA